MSSINNSPVLMEEFFSPGFKSHPLLHIGSQSLGVWQGVAEEQAHEGFHAIASHGDDVVVVRDFDEDYINYWTSLVGEERIINIKGLDKTKYLSQALAEDSNALKIIKDKLIPGMVLLPFLYTSWEEVLANKLGIPLLGNPKINNLYGTKSGIRDLAQEAQIPMAPGFVCRNFEEIKMAFVELGKKFDFVAVKHTLSASGYMSKKMSTHSVNSLESEINKLCGGKFLEGRDVFVVEGWVKNSASLCAQIEIIPGQRPVICAAWQQIIANDGITYLGAGPLQISPKARKSLLESINKLAEALYVKGAVGLFGPDFIVVSDEETNLESGTCILVELNARVPLTAMSLEAVKQIRGKIGNGFCSTNIKLGKVLNFKEIMSQLKKHKLLITAKSDQARGVVPFNVGMLPYKSFDVLVMGDCWPDTLEIVGKVKKIFEDLN